MASKLPSRSLRALRASISPFRASPLVITRRRLSTTPSYCENAPTDQTERPRWSYTPPGTKAPFSIHYNSTRPDFPVNDDPAVLDRFYIDLLGPDGDKVLSEEIKWLAVTHKSFDQGRRGFNDRLAFLGKRIVSLQASLTLVQDAGNFATKVPKDAYRREPFTHPALNGVHNLSNNARNYILNKYNIAKVAQKYDLQKVLRWSPRMVRSLTSPLLNGVMADHRNASPRTYLPPGSMLSLHRPCMPLWELLRWRRGASWPTTLQEKRSWLLLV